MPGWWGGSRSGSSEPVPAAPASVSPAGSRDAASCWQLRAPLGSRETPCGHLRRAPRQRDRGGQGLFWLRAVSGASGPRGRNHHGCPSHCSPEPWPKSPDKRLLPAPRSQGAASPRPRARSSPQERPGGGPQTEGLLPPAGARWESRRIGAGCWARTKEACLVAAWWPGWAGRESMFGKQGAPAAGSPGGKVGRRAEQDSRSRGQRCPLPPARLPGAGF